MSTTGLSGRGYSASALFCGLILVLPFLVVEIPPITDLPQQTAQIRLLFEAFGGSESSYRIQALDPNKLGYLALLGSWWVGTPLAAGRLAMVLLGLAWILSIHLFVYRMGRHPTAATVASLLFFNHLFYWGFLNFLLGLPVFLLFWLWLRRIPSTESSAVALVQGVFWFLLLYSAHVLWLAAALSCFVVKALVERWPPEHWRGVLASALPALLLVAWWYPRFNASGFVSEIAWGRSPLGRLHPHWWLNSMFGGLQGTAEGWTALALLLWVVLGLLTWRRESERLDWTRVHGGLLATGGAFVLAALVLPGVFQHTIFFASRWLPVGGVFLLLAVPPPRLRPVLRWAFAGWLWAGLISAMAAAWIEFDRQELEGLHEALAEIEPGSRLLGLDFVRTSDVIQGFPFYHLYSWGQALHGGELARSFANEASSLVVFEDMPRSLPWTENLDWKARQIRRSDIPHFDFVLIHGGPEVQAPFQADDRLVPRTPELRWRLFEVLEPAGAMEDPARYTSSPSN